MNMDFILKWAKNEDKPAVDLITEYFRSEHEYEHSDELFGIAIYANMYLLAVMKFQLDI